MAFRWKEFNIKRFYGLDLKTNIIDTLPGRCVDAKNVFLSDKGVISKKPGTSVMFNKDFNEPVDCLGSCTLNGTKFYFVFHGGKFSYTNTLTGTLTTITPSPLISTVNQIWHAVLDDKLFFVDGTNALRYFNGTSILVSSIYERPTVAPTGGVGTGFDYTYTVDNSLGESPAYGSFLSNVASGSTITVQRNTGPQTLIIGDKIRIYSKAHSIAAGYKNVTPTTGSFAGGVYGVDDVGAYAQITSIQASYSFVTVAISDTQKQLYSELGVVLNKSAPTGLTGIALFYSRLVGWKSSTVYNSKVTNPHSWPDDSANRESFVYVFGEGDGETITVCKPFRDSVYVMKPSQVAIFGGIGPDDTGNNAYTFNRLETNGNGCIAGKSAKTVGEKDRLMLIYLSKHGFMGTTGSIPIEIGEEISPEIRVLSESTLAAGEAVHDKRLGLYVCSVGQAATRKAWVFDVRADLIAGEQVYFGWFPWDYANVSCIFFDFDRILKGFETGYTASQNITGVSSDFQDPRVEFVDFTAIDVGTDIITVSNVYETGDLVKIRTNGTIPGGLTANLNYYAIYVSDTQIKLATSAENAQAGTNINITSQGTGTHSLVSFVAINAYYTTSWFSFGSPMIVKKLSKLGFIFNAKADTVSITIRVAYDWTPIYTDPVTLTSGVSNEWGTGTWGDPSENPDGFKWGEGTLARPVNYGLPRRKCRSIQFKFENNEINQDFNIQGLNLPFDYIRNRNEYP